MILPRASVLAAHFLATLNYNLEPQCTRMISYVSAAGAEPKNLEILRLRLREKGKYEEKNVGRLCSIEPRSGIAGIGKGRHNLKGQKQFQGPFGHSKHAELMLVKKATQGSLHYHPHVIRSPGSHWVCLIKSVASAACLRRLCSQPTGSGAGNFTGSREVALADDVWVNPWKTPTESP